MKIAALCVLVIFVIGCSPFLGAPAMNNNSQGVGNGPNAPPPPGAPVCSAKVGVRAIYGEDNRRDWYAVEGIEKSYWAAATLALMPTTALVARDGYYHVSGFSYGESRNLCPGTPFAKQTQAAYCSGFLVGNDLVVTAGHCIESQRDCETTKFVFNFATFSAEQTEYNIDFEDVYDCKSLVAHEMRDSDFAVVRLDREVSRRTPLNVRRVGQAAIGDELVLIGHPSGIPSKIADGGLVLSSADEIIAGVDAFAGNSGSVVINKTTGLVEGILVAGEPDYEEFNGCQREFRCNSQNCTGEVITPIGDLLAHIPAKVFAAPDLVCP